MAEYKKRHNTDICLVTDKMLFMCYFRFLEVQRQP